MRPLSQVLTELIGFAEETITKPARHHGFAVDDRFHELAREMRHADALPAEAIRTTRAGMMMVIALEGFFDSDREATSPWLMQMGNVLPMLRAEAWRARRNEREARAAS